MLQVKDLTYRKILKKLSFKIRKKECVSIIGKNGSGKSTLLKCISGILRDYKGLIEINGKDLQNLSMREIASLVSYVPQLIEKRIELKVREFLSLSLFPYSVKLSDKEAKDKIFETVRELDIEELLDRKMYTLSGGEVQKVLISGAVLQGADFILLDEPTSHLDIYRKKEVIDFIFKLKEKGKTLVFVSHNLDEVKELSDRVFVMVDGEIVKDIEKKDIDLLFDKEFQENVYA
ncbi:iron complex transport system ATP-binding protein [Thermotomaculum hydrothermale]|uniref:Iron complex transport system ATP-binding protein n=1 Tax=Thermotomaculum hydrothermale TaxID=981385 RepID=A0A7R6SYC1_9BACT|nr:ABC transporter ATP-binding protein [Thermotomaculum hydrothermale]BBB32401.1 iron complex transport system ATP-binding protein [Thermotomaculum hydrothermale]